MIDTRTINAQADLLQLLNGVQLKKAASSGGGEWAGPCPFCGGRDRFRVQPYHQPEPRWLCGGCTDRIWKDAVELGRRLWPGLPFREVCEKIAGGQLPESDAANLRKAEPNPAYAPPPADWQELAREVADQCAAVLWQPAGAKALAYLHKRGLKDETIRRFGLGYHPQDEKIAGEFWLHRGITIPCSVRGELWYLKVRRATSETGEKYRCMSGSKPAAVYNADDLGAVYSPALIVEGEFDCMLAWQEIGDIVPVVTLGAAGYQPDLATWGHHLLPHKQLLIAFDADRAGEKGAAFWKSLSSRTVETPLPAGPWNDITDYHQAGESLSAWILPHLQRCVPECEAAADMVEAALALGGVCVGERLEVFG